MDRTIAYYNRNAKVFALSTAEVDVSLLQKLFLELLPSHGKILDVGCGGGRDVLHFLNLGYRVDAFDASEELCRIATNISGIDVKCKTFEDYSAPPESYDGIWACASLLHLQPERIETTLKKLITFLKLGGAMYLSFKTQIDEQQAGDRYFCPMTKYSLNRTLLSLRELEIYKVWESEDARPNRKDQWINALVIRTRGGVPD